MPSARWRHLVPLLAAAFALVAPPADAQRGLTPDAARRLAATVTISRDRWGVAHVHAPTDAGAALGFGFAQAEDNYWRVEENYLRAIGRAAEVNGEEAFANDVMNRTLRVEELARRDYEALDARTRAVADAFVAGVDLWATRHPEQRRMLQRMEPWYPLALIRHLYYQNGFLYDPALRGAQQVVTRVAAYAPPVPRALADNQGSNGWVIAPSRSATGRAMLFVNPHLPFFGPSQVYEGHVSSDAGWNFTGYTRFGFPFPYVGHSPNIGWVSTDNAADLADVYAVRFDAADSLRYRYGDGWRAATRGEGEIRVKTAAGVETRRVRWRWTHHGPVVATRNDSAFAIRMARYDEPLGWLAEWYAMTRARNTAELKAAMRPLQMNFGNVMSADRDGTIWYLYNGAVPRRDPKFDWRRAVDGSDPATEWKGYHALEELPQMENPATGWMQNSNTTPFLLTSRGNPDSTRFPRYMVTEGDNPRGKRARTILDRAAKFGWEEWQRIAFDTRMQMADSLVPPLVRFADSAAWTGDERAAVDLLRAWNRRGDTASVATTVFDAWVQQRLRRGDELSPPPRGDARAAMRDALAGLTTRFGRWQVPWGELNRSQRRDERANAPHADSLPSVAIPGVNGADGAVFTFYAGPANGTRRGYGGAGASYVSVVEFGPNTRGRSVHVFGTSGDPKSPHYFDQAPMYARGEMKPAYLTREAVRAGAVRTYRPE